MSTEDWKRKAAEEICEWLDTVRNDDPPIKVEDFLTRIAKHAPANPAADVLAKANSELRTQLQAAYAGIAQLRTKLEEMEGKYLRDRKPNGQYDHERFDRVCVCGRVLGEHLAAFPHPYEDGNLCPKFRPKRTLKNHE